MRVKKIWIWLRRFRHRRGYGVHSPFAFNFITYVINNKTSYYAYEELAALNKVYRKNSTKDPRLAAAKKDKFLFRLVNYAQPANLIAIGPGLALLYMAKAKQTPYYAIESTTEQLKSREAFLKKHIPRLHWYTGNVLQLAQQLATGLQETGLLHYALAQPEEHSQKILEIFLAKASPKSIFVLENIHLPEHQHIWEWLKKDARTGISFDLYHTGVLFFDKSKLKQHYIVNF